jgi:disulfide bond formation protein DsbB
MWNATKKGFLSLRNPSARDAMRVLGLISLFALLAAYVLQYGFGFAPCAMCLKERIPYAVAAIAALLGSCAAARHAWRRLMLLVMVLSFWAGVGLAAYHVGIEMGYITESGCVAASGDASSLDALRAAIMDAPLVSCDQPTAVFFGLSLAMWNALLAILLAFLSTYVLQKYWRVATLAKRTYFK